jgi:hypothetical protein
MSEQNLHKDAARGAQAEALLDNELVKAAFDDLKAAYMDAWEATAARDTDSRERLWQAVQIVGKVKTHLHSVVANGKIAARELEEIGKLNERKKIFGIV